VLVSSDVFVGDVPAANTYVALRAKDAAQLLNEMQWNPGSVNGVLQCRIYGHSILWDVAGVLHAGKHAGLYEVLFNGEDDPEAYLTLAQVLAMVLAKNW
jgi:hypothetical protein